MLSRSELTLYDRVVQGVDEQASDQENRAYGGKLRSVKGELVEKMARDIIRLGWQDIGGKQERLSFGNKKYKVYVTDDQSIHKSDFFKPLEIDCLDHAIGALGKMLRPFV